jgi:FAD/FMN-containing dehydrogenase
MSGRLATIGGGMSQGAATFGSARHGTSASAALAFEVVLGDGTVLDTGSGGGSGGSFFRPYGPDLTGLFTGDAGALGIKTAVTLQLERRPATHGAVAFGFDAFGPMTQAVSAVAREGLATEIFGLESSLATLAAADAGREPAWRTALAVARAQNGPWRALVQLARIAAAGRSFARGTAFTANFIAEARDGAALGRALDAIRGIAARTGREIPNTLAAVVRATPFPEPPVVGPGGRRLLALHAILPHSRVDAFHDAVLRLREAESAALQAHRAALFVVFAVVGPSAVLHEPVIYWEDEWNDLHHATLPAALRGTLCPGPANPAGRAYVEQLRQRLVALMAEHGAAHLQIGRAYPYLQGRSPTFLATVGALKRLTDPHNLINPGALGLPP